MSEKAVKLHSQKDYSMKPPKVKGLPFSGLLRCVAVGPSGCGKTAWLVDTIIRLLANVERIYVWSPSVFLDDAWKAVRDYSENHLGVNQDKERTFFDHYKDSDLRDVIDLQVRVIQQAKKLNMTQLPQIAIVVDDFADDPSVLHANNAIGLLFIRGRHAFINAFVGCQKLTLMSPILRTQATNLAICRVRNGKELAAITEELSGVFPAPVIKALYEKATEEPHSFLWVNLMAKKKEDMFWLRLDGGRLLVQDLSESDDEPVRTSPRKKKLTA